jgi:hypothetical protein
MLTFRTQCTSDQYYLYIAASAERYQLILGDPESDMHWQPEVLVSELAVSPLVGGAFTGTMFGLYAFGNGEPCLDPADFSNVSCTTIQPELVALSDESSM